MSKYLTRSQVMADFKINILPSLKNIIGDDFKLIREIWDDNLDEHLRNNSITESQRNTWKIKESDIL